MKFLGRKEEMSILLEWAQAGQGPRMAAIYGRRRVGKTRLVEETVGRERLMKFEGIEGEGTAAQQKHFLSQLAEISGRSEYGLVRSADWKEILGFLADHLNELDDRKPIFVFFDEFQWMAAERKELVSHLKYVWDNKIKKKSRIRLILCGSVCSFMVKKVLQSKALYGRIDLEMELMPLELPEIKDVFLPKRSLMEVLELYMAVGGIPKYLELVDPATSVRGNLNHLCFSRDGYLVKEFDRIFSSHFGSNPYYRQILQVLSKGSLFSRDQLQKACKVESGGRLSEYLENLSLAGFVDRRTPVDNPESSRIYRHHIVDPYLLFYFRFIEPHRKRISRSRGRASLSTYVTDRQYDVWRGLAFEKLCLQHSHIIAQKLGFSAVKYDVGPWFQRSQDGRGAQVDLLFLRADRVATVCEIKCQRKPIGKGVIAQVEKKKEIFSNKNGYTLEQVLVTTSPPSETLQKERYFSRILTIEDLFDSSFSP